MSASGQKRTLTAFLQMSALPLKVDIRWPRQTSASQNPAAFKRPLRLWPFNHRKPFGRWKALTRNGSDPLNAPYPGRAGDKSNLKR